MKSPLVFILLFAFCDSILAASPKPNIIFILADDVGWGDLGCYGHPYAKTPHLDKLAAEGTRFLQCYATGVTCCPSRTGFMTSKFPASFASYPANGGFGERVTITELLKKEGYATAHFGKWHIGPEPQPGTYGIDVIGSEEGAEGMKKDRASRSRDAHIYDSVLNFIEKHKEGPFYINVWDHISHHPVNPSPALIDAFGPLQVDESKFSPFMREKFAACKKQGGDVSEHMRAFLADVKSMDDEVGRLLKRLDELNLRDNTIVVFSSDQGPADIRDPSEETTKERPNKKKKESPANADGAGNVRLNAMGYAGPFRGGKHGQYEGGVRIPFIVRWPGHTPAGRVDEKSVISGADWLPTLCALTGTKIDPAGFDGEDASAAWLGQAEHVRAKPLLWKTSSPKSDPAIRFENWKLHLSQRKLGEHELYDLASDPAESNNLAAKHPDLVTKLSAKLEAWTSTLPKEYEKTGDSDE